MLPIRNSNRITRSEIGVIALPKIKEAIILIKQIDENPQTRKPRIVVNCKGNVVKAPTLFTA